MTSMATCLQQKVLENPHRPKAAPGSSLECSETLLLTQITFLLGTLQSFHPFTPSHLDLAFSRTFQRMEMQKELLVCAPAWGGVGMHSNL